MPTVLVTGGAGFIGSHVARAYLSHGHRVVIADNLAGQRKDLIPKEAEFHQVDIRDAALNDLFAEVRPDIVNHHAAQISVPYSVREPLKDLSSNVYGSANVLEAAARHHVKRFIFASTGGALYGEPQYHPCDEQHPIMPLSPYGVAKFCTEQYVRYYAQMRDMTSVVLRYANVYGPNQDPHGEAGVVAIFTQRMLEKEPSVIFGDGEQQRDFVYVGDVAQANVLALDLGDNGTYNIGTGAGHSVNELHRLLGQATAYQVPAEYEQARPGDVLRITLDSSKAARDLGWRPETSFQKGLELTVQSFADQRSSGDG